MLFNYLSTYADGRNPSNVISNEDPLLIGPVIGYVRERVVQEEGWV